MTSYLINLILTNVIIAFVISFFFVVILKKRVFGSFWGGFLFSLLGAFLGYFISSQLIYQLSLPFTDIIANGVIAVLMALAAIYILYRVSSSRSNH